MANQPQAPRIGVVGARRRHSGIGEHVARHLVALGAEVPAIVGTRPETVAAAQQALRSRWGLSPRGYTSLEAMLASERLDAVALCSPYRCHALQLELALEAGLHVLCEKPLIFEPGRDLEAAARLVVEGFAAAGLVLMVNAQWPQTLATFQKLHPPAAADGRPLDSLAMLLGPSGPGLLMIPDALPHLASLLLALAPAGGSAEDVRLTRWQPQGQTPHSGQAATAAGEDSLRLSFHYRWPGDEPRRTAATLFLRPTASQPRPSGYAINGHAVRRLIRTSDYRMSLEALPDERGLATAALATAAADEPVLGPRARLTDPLVSLLANFLSAIGEPSIFRPQTAEILTSLRLLTQVAAAAEEQVRAWDRVR